MPNIHVITHDRTIRVYDFSKAKKKISIGRGKDNDIVLRDPTVSRNHAEILKTKEGYLITDLGSFNGTLVNEESIPSALLKHDDQIKIGLNKLTFLTKKEGALTSAAPFQLTSEGDNQDDIQQIIKSSPQDGLGVSAELLISGKAQEGPRESAFSIPSEGVAWQAPLRSDFSSLGRSNKVLFVLYEISRQLTSIPDFNELLKKIMDLIFMVIDADYGFLVLTGQGENDLMPVVVKYKDNQTANRRQLKASQTIIGKVIRDKVALLTSNAMADPHLGGAKSILAQQIRSAMCVPLWRKDKIIGVIQLDSVRLDNQFGKEDLALLKAIGSQMAMIIEQASLNEQIREEERMRSRLERYHSPQVIEMILKGDQERKEDLMEPKDLTATILFTDIIGFTRLAEQMPPRDVNMILNQYFRRMTDIVFQYDGTLDKYIGDGLMAVFGAPMEKEDDAERAILAAKKMREELLRIRAQRGIQGKFNIRIGINTGRVVAGNIGSPKRMDYTVIGDPVNIAARLEAVAEPNQILIGEETYRRVKGKFKIKEVGPRMVKGKRAEIMVYEVID